ncbi:hypothetical protein [Prosthecobacter sp.]|uniref:hypothetical protein n=1 Tax=Prosthecobacter sp. TaxID=1965333 RepID=UPI0037846E43
MNAARVFWFLIVSGFVSAADLVPKLGGLGEKLLDEEFTGAGVPEGWRVSKGALRVSEGVLLGAEKGAELHIGEFHYDVPLQDFVAQIDFKLGEARDFILCFEPSQGELKKTGMLFSIQISKTRWSIISNKDNSNIYSVNKMLSGEDTAFDPAKIYTLMVECKGDKVVAQVAGKEPLKAEAADMHVKKPGLIFWVGGRDGEEIAFDNVTVWRLN